MVGLYHGCLSSNQEISQGSKVRDGALVLEYQGGGVYNGASQWEF